MQGSTRGSQLPSPLFARPAVSQPPQALTVTSSSDWDDVDTASSSSGSSSGSFQQAVGSSRIPHSSGRRPSGHGVGARVLFDFAASGPGELSVRRGQSVRALYHVDRRWLFVLTQAGHVGYIPFLYAAKEDWTRWRPVPSLRRYCRGLAAGAAAAGAGDASSDSGNCDTGSSSNSSGNGTGAEQPAECAYQQKDGRLCLPTDLTKPPMMSEHQVALNTRVSPHRQVEDTLLQPVQAAVVVHHTVSQAIAISPFPSADYANAASNTTSVNQHTKVSRASTMPHATAALVRCVAPVPQSTTLPSRRGTAGAWNTAFTPTSDVFWTSGSLKPSSYNAGIVSSNSIPYATPSRQFRPHSMRLNNFGGHTDLELTKAESNDPLVYSLLVPPVPPPAPRRQRRPSFDSAVAASSSGGLEPATLAGPLQTSRCSVGVANSTKRVTFRDRAEIIGVADNIDRQPYCHESNGNIGSSGSIGSTGLITKRLAKRYVADSDFSKATTGDSQSDPDTDSAMQTLV